MITLQCTYHHGTDLRTWEVSADTLTAALRDAYRHQGAMSADVFDAIYADILREGKSDRFSWLRVTHVGGEL